MDYVGFGSRRNFVTHFCGQIISVWLLQFLFLQCSDYRIAFGVFSLSLSRCLAASALLAFQLPSQSEKIFSGLAINPLQSTNWTILGRLCSLRPLYIHYGQVWHDFPLDIELRCMIQ